MLKINMTVLEDKSKLMKKYLLLSLVFLGLFSAEAQQDLLTSTRPKANSVSSPHAQSKDKNPEFPGGLQAFRKEFVSNFQTQTLLASGIKEASATAMFVVEKDGSMSDIKIEAYKNEIIRDEFLKALKKINTKWIAGEKDGEKVRIRMRQPLIFKTVK
ncbi:hypothetical protein SRABI04_00438 [Chryseobacterium sp. Bi04]|nr:hypothetical protein SRABI04_00438 [Chryseobacterium sp. Bi04]